jgi:hypothetical protein
MVDFSKELNIKDCCYMLADTWSMSEANLKNMLQNLWGAAAEMVVHEQDLNEDMSEIVMMFQDTPGFSQHGQDDAEAWFNKDAADPGYQILTEEETATSVQVEECAAISQGDSDDQEEEESIKASDDNILMHV